jgi:hypothetical protein
VERRPFSSRLAGLASIGPRFGGDLLLEQLHRPSWKPAVRPLGSTLDAAARMLRGCRCVCPHSLREREQLTPQALLGRLPSVTSQVSLSPDYDEAFLEWLFAEMASVKSRGSLIGRLVHDGKGRMLGWYLAYLRRGGVCQAIQVAAVDRAMQQVFDHEAWRYGGSVLRGRLEPRLFEPVWQRRCYYGTANASWRTRGTPPSLRQSAQVTAS